MAVADPEGAEPGTDARWRCVANGLTDIDAETDPSDARRLILRFTTSAGDTVEFAYRMPIPLFAGLWSGTQPYSHGDMVQKNGCTWLCLEDGAATAPGEGSQWALMAKQGKPGPRGDQGPRGDRGLPGAPGVGIRDIDQENGMFLFYLDDDTVRAVKAPVVQGLPVPVEEGEGTPIGRFRGMWKLGAAFVRGDVVRYSRGLWLATATVPAGEVPGQGMAWTNLLTVQQVGVADGSTGATGGGMDQAAADARYVKLTGDRMIGQLLLPGAPTNDAHAVNKAYVDRLIAQIPHATTFVGNADLSKPIPPEARNSGDFYFHNGPDGAVVDGSWPGIAGLTVNTQDAAVFDGMDWNILEGNIQQAHLDARYVRRSGDTVDGAMAWFPDPVSLGVHHHYEAVGDKGQFGGDITLDFVSWGATINFKVRDWAPGSPDVEHFAIRHMPQVTGLAFGTTGIQTQDDYLVFTRKAGANDFLNAMSLAHSNGKVRVHGPFGVLGASEFLDAVKVATSLTVVGDNKDAKLTLDGVSKTVNNGGETELLMDFLAGHGAAFNMNESGARRWELYGNGMTLSLTGFNDAGQRRLAWTVDRTTGVMTFRVPTIGVTPTNDAHLATKKYVDDKVAAAGGAASTGRRFLPLSGGTMTGTILLAAPPVADLEPATKRYVDDAIAALAARVAALEAKVP
jgi:hypothetical protein